MKSILFVSNYFTMENVTFEQTGNTFSYSFTVQEKLGPVRKTCCDNPFELKQYTVSMLKELCKALGIKLDKSAKRADMVQSILNNPTTPFTFY